MCGTKDGVWRCQRDDQCEELLSLFSWHTDFQIDYKDDREAATMIASSCIYQSESAGWCMTPCWAVYGVSVFSEACGRRSASLACHGHMWQAINGALWLNKQPSEARCGLGRLQLESSPRQAKNVQYSFCVGTMSLPGSGLARCGALMSHPCWVMYGRLVNMLTWSEKQGARKVCAEAPL